MVLSTIPYGWNKFRQNQTYDIGSGDIFTNNHKSEGGIRMMKKALLITAFLLTVFTCWATVASANEVKLIFATTDVSRAHLNVEILHPWAQRINEQGKGIINIDVRDGFTLANHQNFYDRVQDDVVQIAWGIMSTVTGKFERSGIMGIPYLSMKSEDASVAYWRLYKSGLLDDEYDEIVPLFVAGFPQSSLHLAKPLKSIDNISGLKIATGSKYGAGIVKQLGATPIFLPLPDYYEGLQRGTVDGIVMTWTAFQPFKLAEVTKYHIDTQLGGAPGAVFMTKKRYNALPPEARKIIEANSGEAQSRMFGAFWDRVQDEWRQKVKGMKDHTVVSLTAEQTAEWRKRVAPLAEEWIKNTPDGEKVYAKYTELVNQLEAGN